MASLNRIVLVGRLASEPELRYTANNLAVASFTVAVDRPFSKSSGQEKKTDFFRCKAWRQKADFVSQYIQKGRLVAVEGRVELNDYTGQDGVRKYFTEVVVDNIDTLEPPRNQDGGREPDHGNGYEADYGNDAPQAAPGPRTAAPGPRRAGGYGGARTAAPAANNPPRPAQRPVQPVYPGDEEDFDDSDPFADEN